MALMLLIGNKNYSSWSMRPWLAMTVAGIPFTERLVPLESLEFAATVQAASPAGKVPALLDGDIQVWDSLSILEYLAERFPAAGLWPKDPQARATARSVACEMHSGFSALRSHCAMNFARPVIKRPMPADVTADVARIDALWTECRQRYGAGGPFLFGAFGAADAMFAPVVSRFDTYAIAVGPVSQAYMRAVAALPGYVAWKAAGIAEPWVVAKDEPDWPNVPR